MGKAVAHIEVQVELVHIVAAVVAVDLLALP